jgi:hypothetical protein
MKLYHSIVVRALVLLSLAASLTVLSSQIKADTGTCGGTSVTLPFTDVMGNPFFCQIAAAYFSGLTNGTTATTYSPGQMVTREQMAAFTTRTLDQSLKRGSEQVIAEKLWIPQNANSLGLTPVGSSPQLVEFDGTDLWVANASSASVMRIKASDGRVLDTWGGATGAVSIVSAMGKVFVTGATSPGSLYLIDLTQPAGTVTTLTSALGNNPLGVAFDGSRIWTANEGSVSIVSLNPTSVTTISTGFGSLRGILYDGTNIWVTDNTANAVLKLNSDGSIAQTIAVGTSPRHPVFDGINIWVPNRGSNSITVVRAKDAQGNALASAFVLATLTGNGLNEPLTTAFDGEHILVTNINVHTVALWKATDLSPLGSFSTGANTQPLGACSDGMNFWITLNATNQLARF